MNMQVKKHLNKDKNIYKSEAWLLIRPHVLQTTNPLIARPLRSIKCMVMSCTCFGPRHSPCSNFLCRAPDIAAVGTNLKSLVMTWCRAKIQTYHLPDNKQMHNVLRNSCVFRLYRNFVYSIIPWSLFQKPDDKDNYKTKKYEKVTNQHMLNGRTDFLLTFIELLCSLNLTVTGISMQSLK